MSFSKKILESIKSKPQTATELIATLGNRQGVYRALCDMKKAGILRVDLENRRTAFPHGRAKKYRYTWTGIEPAPAKGGRGYAPTLAPDQPHWLFGVPDWRRKKFTYANKIRELEALGFKVIEPKEEPTSEPALIG